MIWKLNVVSATFFLNVVCPEASRSPFKLTTVFGVRIADPAAFGAGAIAPIRTLRLYTYVDLWRMEISRAQRRPSGPAAEKRVVPTLDRVTS